jgi:hypothetical protein
MMVPGAGLEPARGFPRGILNPLCLPISPPGHVFRMTIFDFERHSNGKNLNCEPKK